MLVKIEQCLNGYLLSIGDMRIVLSTGMKEELAAALGPAEIIRGVPGKPPKTKKTKAPKIKTPAQPAKRKYKKRKKADPSEVDNGKKYKCEECGKIFFSTDNYKNVRCECGTKRVMSLP